MGSGIFYARTANTKRNVKGNRFVRSFLFAGMLLLGMPMVSKATPPPNIPPTYVAASPQMIAVCQNSSGVDISSSLTINDPDLLQTETWTVLGAGPLNGTVTPTTYSASSTGGIVILPPNSFTYTPNPGFSSGVIDTFTIEVSDGTNTARMFFQMTVNQPPAITLSSIPAICAGTTSATQAFTGLFNVGPTSTTFNIENTTRTWTVPAGVTSINFDISGGAGGADNHSGAPNPGKGGRVQGTLAVTPGQTLYLTVGGQGGPATIGGALGGYNGGGNAYYYSFIPGTGGAGGGASDIRVGGTALTNRIVVAGGGGGNGWDTPGPLSGGNGGNNALGFGGNSANNNGLTHSGGGSQAGGGLPATYAGWSPGTAGTLGVGGNGSVQGVSGGGGGGYYGGGGGVWTGGGGGSSYTNPLYASGVTHTQGYNNGDGQITLSYTLPGTYTIQWSTAAQTTGGFTASQTGVLPSSPITIDVPGGAPAGTYDGTFFINNTLCQSIEYPIAVTVNPIPDVAVVPNQVFCNGDDSTTGAGFSNVIAGMYPSTVFHWTNDNPAIGIDTAGNGDIAPFAISNTTPNPITAHILVTPKQFGCAGEATTFNIVVNPTPSLSVSTVSPICNYGPFSFNPASGTLGTSFLWTATPTTGAVIAAPSGSDNPNDSITNTTTNDITVPFVYTLAANSCQNVQTVNVVVHPSPVLSSPTSRSVCSAAPFSYTATSATPSVSFAWSREAAGGITPSPVPGTGNINETLTNSTTDPVQVTYDYTNTITGTGCSFTQKVLVTVNPMPVLDGSPLTPAAICDGAAFDSSVFDPHSATAGTSYTWSRASNPAINSGLPGGGPGKPNERLNNSTPYPVTVVYAFNLTANGCSNLQYINETVNPTPKLTSGHSLTVCDSTLLTYNPTSLTGPVTFEWQRNPMTGISNSINSAFGNPAEYLNNITALPIVDTYFYTLTAYGCTNLEKVQVKVNPSPKISIPLTAPTICDSTVFNYPVASNTPGVSFSWFRPYIPGIYAAAESGTGNPNQALYNSTYVTVDVTYIYSLTYDGCTDSEYVHVIVNPTPKLTSSLTNSVCSGSPFNYTPTSFTPGATFVWNRPGLVNITPGTNFGVGNVNETVTNLTLSPITVDYQYRLGIGSCQNLYYQTVRVVVNPTPPAPGITTTAPSSVCMNTLYQNFAAGPFVSPNIDYTWSASNAFVYATGTNNQNALVNFYSAGSSTVTVSANVHGYSCQSKSTIDVNVSNSQADVIPVVVYNTGEFICLQNNNDSYQWGFDDVNTLEPTTLSGQIDQAYNNPSPDFAHKRYWVITNTNGCMQKAYYDDPPSNTGISNVNGAFDVNIYPNPTTDNINVELNTTAIGKMQVEVMNMLGQRLVTQPLVNNKTNINVASLPVGNYLVACYYNGVKVANAKFSKN